MSGHLLILLAFTAICFGQVSADGKHRSLAKVMRDCQEITQKLKAQSTSGILQWEPHCTQMLMRDDFKMGILPGSGGAEKAVVPIPTNRVTAMRPGEKVRPTLPAKLPESYNARTIYGRKCLSFNMIANQGNCSNCWAVAAVNMINDRVCMYSKDGTPQKFYSAKHLTLCVNGCKGAWVYRALDYWFESGVPTGGFPDTNQPSGCKPYFKNFYVEMKDGYCNNTCDDKISKGSDRSWGGSRGYSLSNNITAMMNEIYLYGPIVAAFDIYEDFYYYYKKGVYKRVSNKYVARHAVKLFGWGVENGVPFWHAMNTWGTPFGEGGFFKIQRGTNEVTIESEVFTAMPLEGVYTING